MNELKSTIIEQLQQLQMLMHRTTVASFTGNGRGRNPLRGQGRVLAMLKIKPEISQRDLTYLLGMSKQSIAELLLKLEKNEFITRHPSENDKRVMIIELTEKGEKAAGSFDDSVPDSAVILDCLEKEELGRFSDYLGRIIKRCEEQFPNEDFEQRHRALREFMAQRNPCSCDHLDGRTAEMRDKRQNARGNGFSDSSTRKGTRRRAGREDTAGRP